MATLEEESSKRDAIAEKLQTRETELEDTRQQVRSIQSETSMFLEQVGASPRSLLG